MWLFLDFLENAKDYEIYQISALMINDHICFTSLNLLCIYIYWCNLSHVVCHISHVFPLDSASIHFESIATGLVTEGCEVLGRSRGAYGAVLGREHGW